MVFFDKILLFIRYYKKAALVCQLNIDRKM
jgi:hypothetical protein